MLNSTIVTRRNFLVAACVKTRFTYISLSCKSAANLIWKQWRRWLHVNIRKEVTAMPETFDLELTEHEAQGLRELIAECVQKMKQAHEVMARDEVEIAEMQAETREILAREWKGGVDVERPF